MLQNNLNFALLTGGAACTKPPSTLQNLECRAQRFYNGSCISRFNKKRGLPFAENDLNVNGLTQQMSRMAFLNS